MQAVHHLFRGNSDSTHEERALVPNHDFSQLGKLAVCVIVLRMPRTRKSSVQIHVGNAMHTYVCLAGVASDLREQKVDAERCIFVLKMGFDVVNRLLEDFGRLVQSTDDADATL